MPRVQVQKAAKDYPNAGIKKGDMYYKWSFRYGGTRMSKTRPRPSQLTQSPFKSEALSIQEAVEDLPSSSDLPSLVEDIVSRLRDLASETESSKENMPEGLQASETGQLLEARKEACETYADELEGIDLTEWEAEEGKDVNSDGETEEEYWEAKKEEVQNASFDWE